MKFYMVMCHRGHCGTGHGTEIKFAIRANNLLEACDKARRMPSVKHSRMAIYGKEITEQEYREYRERLHALPSGKRKESTQTLSLR